MTMTALTASYPDPYTVVLAWASDTTGTTFYIYRDGVLIQTTQATTATFTIEDGDYPVFDLFDDAGAVPADGYPARLEICWLPVAAVDYYRVDEYVGAAWTERARVSEEGLSFYSWTSRPLEDDTTHLFRVVPVGTNGNDGTAQSYSWLQVRYPDPPLVVQAYAAATGLLTVSAG